MSTQTAIPFASFLVSLGDLQPNNLEHLQARAKDVHVTALQLIADSDYPPEVIATFPVMNRFEDRTVDEVTVWWSRFSLWLESLDLETFHRINAEFVIAEPSFQ